jgi:hypothetical protein
MARAIPRLALIPILLMLVPACSGPSAPSPATTASPTAAPVTTVPEPGVPADAAASGGFAFVSSNPAPGGETSVTESVTGSLRLEVFDLRLTVHYSEPLADGKVEVRLFDEGGRQCAFRFVDQAIVPNHSIVVRIPSFLWSDSVCRNFPVGIATIKATLVTARDVGGPFLERTEYATATFPLRYTIRRYPPPPGGPETPPTISRLEMLVFFPVGGAPGPDDPIALACTGNETDGAPVTVRITQRWEGRAPIVHNRAFPAGASSAPGGARFEFGLLTPSPPLAVIECAVTNDRGQHAVQTMNIPVRR